MVSRVEMKSPSWASAVGEGSAASSEAERIPSEESEDESESSSCSGLGFGFGEWWWWWWVGVKVGFAFAGGGTSLVAVGRHWGGGTSLGMRLLGRFEAAAYRPRCLRATGGLYRRCEVLTSDRRSLEEVRGCYNQGRSSRAGYGCYKRRGVSTSGGGCWGK